MEIRSPQESDVQPPVDALPVPPPSVPRGVEGASPAADLRPLRMGELLDRSATFWRRHVWALFRMYLGFSLALYAVSKAMQLALARWAPIFRGGSAAVALAEQLPPEELFRLIAVGAGLVTVTLLVYSWLSWHAWVALSDYAVRGALGHPIRIEASLRRAVARAGTTTVAFLISAVYAVATMVGFMLPGIGLVAVMAFTLPPGPASVVLVFIGTGLALGGMVFGALWCVLRFLLTCQVVALENAGPFQAILRSGALIAGRIGPGFLDWVKVRATILVTVVALLLMTVVLVSGTPLMIVEVVYGNAFDPTRADPSAVPETLRVPAELLQVVVQSFFAPLYVTFAAFFYLDMRVRREGLDLEMKLERL